MLVTDLLQHPPLLNRQPRLPGQLAAPLLKEFGKTLQGKERVIFERRLLSDGPGTLQEIGDEFGISRERVRQLESRLKNRLREYLLREVKDLKDVDVQAG